MAHIKKQIHAGVTKGYNSVAEFWAAWRLLFDNARLFNNEASQVYNDANTLQAVLEEKLVSLAVEHGFAAELEHVSNTIQL